MRAWWCLEPQSDPRSVESTAATKVCRSRDSRTRHGGYDVTRQAASHHVGLCCGGDDRYVSRDYMQRDLYDDMQRDLCDDR